MTTTIEDLKAREILDSRGQPTIEVICTTNYGHTATASVPAGASTGGHEAAELRDNDPKRFDGRGVLSVIAAVQGEIREALAGMPVAEQRAIDDRLVNLDGTDNKSRLGANAILGVSMAVARAGARAAEVPLYRYLGGDDSHRLPIPSFNVLNGGAHAAWQGADFQEYMAMPHGAAHFSDALRWATDIYRRLKDMLKEQGIGTGVGDEGGFAPTVQSNRQPLDWLLGAIENAGLRPGRDVSLAFDAAASELRPDHDYELSAEGRSLTADELIEYYEDLAADYPIRLLEDGLHEDDWAGWQRLNRQLGDRLTLVGDDIFVTQSAYIERGIHLKCANAVLIKLNQVGTVSETVDAVGLAHSAGWETMVSHRSGETTDDFIADLAVAVGSRYIKSGAPARGERVAKYNRLMAIEAELGARATFAGGEDQ
ncbi:phosphopyruvate hydratase [Salinisphaera hydrothermalis]|uniref:phosphopyruvate hydratase n=1 Tax=Salinisphaera hydrothermalis TaxID=563188 RepID=UPI0033415A02